MSTNIEFAPITFESNSDLKVEDTKHVFHAQDKFHENLKIHYVLGL